MFDNIPIVLHLILLVFVVQWLSIYFARLATIIPLLRYLLFPGIFLHEFSHFVAAKLTGARVAEFKIGFHEGHVKHGKPKIPLVGMMLITLAPLVIGIIILIFTFRWVTGISVQEISGEGITGSLYQLINSINFLSWQFWVGLYIFINVLATFAPSGQDFKNSIIPIFLYVIASLFIQQFNAFNVYLVNILLIVLAVLLVSIVVMRGVTYLVRKS